MSALQFLRQSKHIARWVLVWFALSLTAAVAAPVLNPQGLTLVCTAAGQVKLVSAASGQSDQSDQSDQGVAAKQGSNTGATGLHQHLDCVLCLALDVPPVRKAVVPLPLAVPVALIRADAAPLVPQPRVHSVSARGPPAVAGPFSV